jgi:hypothetical protein
VVLPEAELPSRISLCMHLPDIKQQKLMTTLLVCYSRRALPEEAVISHNSLSVLSSLETLT